MTMHKVRATCVDRNATGGSVACGLFYWPVAVLLIKCAVHLLRHIFILNRLYE